MSEVLHLILRMMLEQWKTMDEDLIVYRLKQTAEMAQQLERERDEARTRCQDLETAFANFANERFEEIQKVRKERDEARKHLAAANKGAEINAHINNSLTAKLAEARGVLQEIANASHFDNIGNWARNKARQALEELK
jgi:hypothetical protein